MSPSLCVKLFDTRTFLEHLKVPPIKFFGIVRQKIFDSTMMLASYASEIPIADVFRNIEWFRHDTFWHSETKNVSTENSETPFLFIKFFGARNFLKHWSVPLRIFLAL